VFDDPSDTPNADGKPALAELLGDDLHRGIRVQEAMADDLADDFVRPPGRPFGPPFGGAKGLDAVGGRGERGSQVEDRRTL
jgi:hypothetical protein